MCGSYFVSLVWLQSHVYYNRYSESKFNRMYIDVYIARTRIISQIMHHWNALFFFFFFALSNTMQIVANKNQLNVEVPTSGKAVCPQSMQLYMYEWQCQWATV